MTADAAAIAWPVLLAAALGGYLLGSIPFGLVLTRAAGRHRRDVAHEPVAEGAA